MNQSRPNNLHYPALDGIRGLAILLVVIYHNFDFLNISYFGWLGVDLFFVLSGYLITKILLNSLGEKNFLRNFYIRRVLRIFPLYYGSLLVLLLILPKIFPDYRAFDYFVEHQLWLWVFLQNWLFIFIPHPGLGILNHYWSLAVEEQFYLVWPFVIMLVRKEKILLYLLIVLLALVMFLRLYVWLNQVDVSYFNLYTFTRIDGICIGSMVAIIQRTNKLFLSKTTFWIVIGFAGLNFLFDFINRFYQFTFPYLPLVGYTTFAMMFGLLVHEATVSRDSLVARIFDTGFMKFFGKISFGLYVFHWPIYFAAKNPVASWWQNYSDHYVTLVSSIIPTLAAIALSVVSYYYFESPFLRMKKRYTSE
ncbi:MAG: acyltransferase family protein [Flavisolibacter sp.]